MKEAVEVQKDQFKDIDLDKLEDIRDDMEEMMEDTKYINEELNRNYAIDVNEDELNEDMKQLDDDYYLEMLKSQKNNQPNIIEQNK